MARSLALALLALALVALPTRAEIIQITNTATSNGHNGKVVTSSGSTLSYNVNANDTTSNGYDTVSDSYRQDLYAYSSNTLAFTENATGLNLSATTYARAYNSLGGNTSASAQGVTSRTTSFQVDRNGVYDVTSTVNPGGYFGGSGSGSAIAMVQLRDITVGMQSTLFLYQREQNPAGTVVTGGPPPAQVTLLTGHTYSISASSSSSSTPAAFQDTVDYSSAGVSIAPAAVPEPASLAMLALGLGGAGLAAARRRGR